MTVSIDNIETNYFDLGEKSDFAVVMLHGWASNIELFRPSANLVATKYRVLAMDLPGHGETPEPPTDWHVDDYADFVTHFLAHFGVKRVILLGHSYGGRVIIKLAALDRLPFRIERIVLIDSAGVLPIRTPQQERKIRTYKTLKKLLDNRVVRFLIPETVKEWKSRQGSADYRNATPVMRQCLVMAVNEDLTEYLPKVRQETLLIWGDKDTATPIRDAKIMEEKMPNAGLAVIEGTGHYSFLEDPVRFRGILQAFLLTGVKA